MTKSIDTEKKILEAAREVFLRKGMAGARMQEIADEAGINKALLHYYFRSKDKLFDRIFEEVLDKLSINVLSRLSDDVPVFDKLKMLIDGYVDVLQENPFLPMFVLNEMNQNPERLQKRMLEKRILDDMISLIPQLTQEMSAGNIVTVHPVHLMMNITGLLIFPFAVRPMVAPILNEKQGIDYEALLDDRKKVVFEFVCNALKSSHEK